jgi:hypothetical protein
MSYGACYAVLLPLATILPKPTPPLKAKKMSTPSSPNSLRQADHDRIAQAALQRIAQPANPGETEELRYEHERPIRQKFRRLVDPGIIRENGDAENKRVSLTLT